MKDKHPAAPQEPGKHKVEDAHNRTGHQAPTQTNQGQRTPDSRSDRTDHIGSDNQSQSRKGGVGKQGHGPA